MRKQWYLHPHRAGNAATIDRWRETLHSMRRRWKTLAIPRAALLVIDMQRYFLDASSHALIPSAPAIIPNVRRLISTFRRERRPIVFTYFAVENGEEDPVGRWWGQSVATATDDSLIVSELRPARGEKIIRKTSYSSFHGTDLEAFLREQGVQHLVITGVLTNLCCETAAREAFVRGFDVFFVADATATFTEEMHRSTLLNLSYGFATPILARDLRPLSLSP